MSALESLALALPRIVVPTDPNPGALSEAKPPALIEVPAPDLRETEQEEDRLVLGEASPNGQKRRTKGRARASLTLVDVAGPVAWETPMSDWITSLQAARKLSTVRDYRSRLTQVRTWAEGQGITLDKFRARELDQYLVMRQQAGVVDSSRRHEAIICKAFLKWCFLRKHLKSDPLQGYEIPKAQTQARVVPSAEDIGKLLQAVDDCWNIHKTDRARYTFEKARRFLAARDTAIILAIIATGGRIGEVLGLRLEDVRTDVMELTFRETKSGHPRTVPLSAAWQPYLETYLKLRPRCDNPFLFINADGGSYDQEGNPRPMPLNSWGAAWLRYMKRAGLSGWSRHNLRHYAATYWAVDQGNLVLANAMLGHKDMKTTQIYVHNSARQLQAAFAPADPLGSIPILVNRRKASRPKLL